MQIGLRSPTRSTRLAVRFRADDYSPTIGIDKRLESAKRVDFAGKGLMPKNEQPRFGDCRRPVEHDRLRGEPAFHRWADAN
jgi:hypothetical protein